MGGRNSYRCRQTAEEIIKVTCVNRKNNDINDSDWLILLAKENDISEIKHDALTKLHEKGFSDKKIIERYRFLKFQESGKDAFDKYWEKQLNENKNEKYSSLEKIKIFFVAPYDLFMNFQSGLVELYKYNYRIKFKQRLILIIGGILFYIFSIVAILVLDNYLFMKKVDKVDISKWEKNRIDSDSLSISSNND